MPTSRTIGTLACVLGAAIMSGCYTYVPVERPAPGSVVRIDIPVRSAVTGTRRDEEDIESLEGTVLTAGDSLVLQMESTRDIGNFREIHSVDTVRVAVADLAGVSTRTFSSGKTIGLTAVIVGGVVALAVAALDVGGGSQGGGPPGPGTGSSIVVKPIFSMLLRALGR